MKAFPPQKVVSFERISHAFVKSKIYIYIEKRYSLAWKKIPKDVINCMIFCVPLQLVQHET